MLSRPEELREFPDWKFILKIQHDSKIGAKSVGLLRKKRPFVWFYIYIYTYTCTCTCTCTYAYTYTYTYHITK